MLLLLTSERLKHCRCTHNADYRCTGSSATTVIQELRSLQNSRGSRN